MPHFDENTPRAKYKVQDMDLLIPHIYAEGHTLSEDEALFLNTRLASLMVNGYGGDLRREMTRIDDEREKLFKEGKWGGETTNKSRDGKTELRHARPAWATPADLEGEDWADHQANLDAKFAAYKPGGNNSAVGTGRNALERTAREIAVREVKEIAAKQGKKVKPLMDTEHESGGSLFNYLVGERLKGKHKERIFELARAQLESPEEDDEDEFVIPDVAEPVPAQAAAE